jgi:hypothetical protein
VVEAEGTTLTGVQCGNSSGWQLLEKFERSEHLVLIVLAARVKKKAAGLTGRPKGEAHSPCSDFSSATRSKMNV